MKVIPRSHVRFLHAFAAKAVVAAMISCLVFGLFSAHAIAPDDIPIAHQPVVDLAGVISSQEEQRLNNKLRQWYEQGVMQAAVVVVNSTDGMPIFDYTLSLAERWGLGDAKRDNGLIMVVAVEDRDLYVLTGYGLEGALPDISVKRVVREDITPAFKQGRYGDGINNAFMSITEQLVADPETQQAMIQADNSAVNSLSSDSISLIIPIFIVASVLSAILGRFVAGIIGAGATFGLLTLNVGISFLPALLISLFLGAMILLPIFSTDGLSTRGRRGHGRMRGGFGGGGFGSRGGFGGGGGGFGGGGAGGSW